MYFPIYLYILRNRLLFKKILLDQHKDLCGKKRIKIKNMRKILFSLIEISRTYVETLIILLNKSCRNFSKIDKLKKLK